MQTNHLISANTFCQHYNVEFSFIALLQQHGLIEIMTIEEADYIPENQLSDLEQFVRFYYDLDINLEGIEAITHLLLRLKEKQDEVTQLQNMLKVYM